MSGGPLTSATASASALAERAVAADRRKDHRRALHLYELAVEKLLEVKREAVKRGDLASKNAIKAKCVEYLERAEKIKAYLREKEAKMAKLDEREANKQAKRADEGELGDRLESAIVGERPKINFGDVAGLELAKEALREAVTMPLTAPHLFRVRVARDNGLNELLS